METVKYLNIKMSSKFPATGCQTTAPNSFFVLREGLLCDNSPGCRLAGLIDSKLNFL